MKRVRPALERRLDELFMPHVPRLGQGFANGHGLVVHMNVMRQRVLIAVNGHGWNSSVPAGVHDPHGRQTAVRYKYLFDNFQHFL